MSSEECCLRFVDGEEMHMLCFSCIIQDEQFIRQFARVDAHADSQASCHVDPSGMQRDADVKAMRQCKSVQYTKKKSKGNAAYGHAMDLDTILGCLLAACWPNSPTKSPSSRPCSARWQYKTATPKIGWTSELPSTSKYPRLVMTTSRSSPLVTVDKRLPCKDRVCTGYQSKCNITHVMFSRSFLFPRMVYSCWFC